MKKYMIGVLTGLIIGLTTTAFAGYLQPDVTVYTDPDTKVQYLIVTETKQEGLGAGICPRYTSSGNIMYVGSEIVE